MRRSTVVLSAVWIALFVAYLEVRPAPQPVVTPMAPSPATTVPIPVRPSAPPTSRRTTTTTTTASEPSTSTTTEPTTTTAEDEPPSTTAAP